MSEPRTVASRDDAGRTGKHEASPLDGRPLQVAELRSTLARIRKLGYAESYAQRAANIHGLSVPFFDAQAQVRGNLMVTIPHFRFDPKKQDALVALMALVALRCCS